MSFDPGILVYLIFLAIILYSNHLKKRRQAQARERAARPQEIEVPQQQTQRAAVVEKAPRAPVVIQQAVHSVAKRRPIEAARFKTRDDLRRA